MRLGILTQPLSTNYGGLLQAYALQTVLHRLGHEAEVLQRLSREGVLWDMIYGAFNAVQEMRRRPSSSRKPERMRAVIARHTRRFVGKYIPCSPVLTSQSSLRKYVGRQKFDGYVVGSDQVWRPSYSPCIANYFLDFVSHDVGVRRVAYAASFGVDTWEFSQQDTRLCACLSQQFDAVSVREDSGVRLCREHLGIEAVQVADPTLLLSRSDYERMVRAEGEQAGPGGMFCYILDKSASKHSLIEHVARQTGLSPFFTMPRLEATLRNFSASPEDCVFPPVTRWLRSFMDAQMVVTDSFHGCVFSIIFNKPFWVVGNRGRGMARFHSLLSAFGLEDRLVDAGEMAAVRWDREIDWGRVNEAKEQLRAASLKFLEAALQERQ